MEEDLTVNKNKLEQANKDLEEKEKTLTATEAEVASQNRQETTVIYSPNTKVIAGVYV